MSLWHDFLHHAFGIERPEEKRRLAKLAKLQATQQAAKDASRLYSRSYADALGHYRAKSDKELRGLVRVNAELRVNLNPAEAGYQQMKAAVDAFDDVLRERKRPRGRTR